VETEQVAAILLLYRRPGPDLRDKVRAHRQRLRERGLRPIRMWMPDVPSPAFKATCIGSPSPWPAAHADQDHRLVDAISE
jgi:hypothetical protein